MTKRLLKEEDDTQKQSPIATHSTEVAIPLLNPNVSSKIHRHISDEEFKEGYKIHNPNIL